MLQSKRELIAGVRLVNLRHVNEQDRRPLQVQRSVVNEVAEVPSGIGGHLERDVSDFAGHLGADSVDLEAGRDGVRPTADAECSSRRSAVYVSHVVALVLAILFQLHHLNGVYTMNGV